MKLEWTRLALKDFDKAQDYIAQDNPIAAQAVARRIAEAAIGSYHIQNWAGSDVLPIHVNWWCPGRRICLCTVLAKDASIFFVSGMAGGIGRQRCSGIQD